MKKLLGIVALLLLALVAVVLIRTLRVSSKQIPTDPAPAIALDRPALASRLAGALRFQTISHHDLDRFDGEEFVALHRYLAAQYPLVHARLQRETVNDYTLLYTWKGSAPERKPILLLAHTDVVPPDPATEHAWTHPPFAGHIAEGFIWGRGALDDKVAAVGILEAVEMLLRQGFVPGPTVYLAFGHDEEVGGEAGAKQAAALLGSRGVEVEYVLDEGGALIRELVPGLSELVALVGIAEKGSVSLELSVHTEGGHSSAPPAQTAVGILSTAVHNVENNQMPGGLRQTTHHFFDYLGPELPFAYRLAFANRWLFGSVIERQLAASPATNATVRTTTAATMISGGVKANVLPTIARAVVNFRILPGDTVQDVVDHVRRVVNDPRVEVRLLPRTWEPSPESSTHAASFALLQLTIRQVFPGAVVAPYLTIGGTDARHYARLTRNIYRFAPVVAGQSDLTRVHGIDERISVENYARCVQFFVRLIENSTARGG